MGGAPLLGTLRDGYKKALEMVHLSVGALRQEPGGMDPLLETARCVKEGSGSGTSLYVGSL